MHGESIQKECVKIKITGIINSGAKAWFSDTFGEDELEIGMFVQWPTASITYHEAMRLSIRSWVIEPIRC